MEESLFTAARRIVRFIRIDNEKEGGLLSHATIAANEILAKEVEAERRAVVYTRKSTVAVVFSVAPLFYVRFEGSAEAVEMGPEPPALTPGDEVDIIIRRRK